jgi:hypothetical protein
VVGAPRLKGITPAADEAAEPLPSVGCTTTCVAVMVVPLAVPSTRTLSPLVRAVAEIELVPFWYVVEDASLTVTFWPADVEMVKPAVETVLTVPAAPPEAGPERALDPPPPAALPRPGCPELVDEDVAVVDEDVAVGEGDAAVGEGDAAQAAESPITANATPAAAIRRRPLLDGSRRTLDPPGCLAGVAEAGLSGDDAGGRGGAEPAPPEGPATPGPDVALETGPAGRVSWESVSWGSVGPYSFMMALLLIGQVPRAWGPLMCGFCGRSLRGM